MEIGIVVAVLFLLLFALSTLRGCVIFEYQRGLLYKRGRFQRILEPGGHFYFRPIHTVIRVDTRIINVTLPGQEVLSSDNVGIRLSLAASYRVSDPYLALNKVANYQEALYLLLQMNLRDVIGSLAIDDMLVKREEIGKMLFERSVTKSAEMGIELMLINIKDIMFPGELKTIFSQVVNARKEGLAALERARSENAALRNLANAARLLDNNPNLLQLRLFQVLEKSSGNTVVIMPTEGTGVSKILEKLPAKKTK